jgi:hypothetical protein
MTSGQCFLCPSHKSLAADNSAHVLLQAASCNASNLSLATTDAQTQYLFALSCRQQAEVVLADLACTCQTATVTTAAVATAATTAAVPTAAAAAAVSTAVTLVAAVIAAAIAADHKVEAIGRKAVVFAGLEAGASSSLLQAEQGHGLVLCTESPTARQRLRQRSRTQPLLAMQQSLKVALQIRARLSLR